MSKFTEAHEETVKSLRSHINHLRSVSDLHLVLDDWLARLDSMSVYELDDLSRRFGIETELIDEYKRIDNPQPINHLDQYELDDAITFLQSCW